MSPFVKLILRIITLYLIIIMKILIVEDEVKIAQAIKKGLEQEAYAVDIANDGDSGAAFIEAGSYDLAILDIMMPGKLNGLGILASMRRANDQTPVLLLTAKGSVGNRVEGLNTGADDYLIKPFAFEELLARVRALLRRPAQSLSTVLEHDDLSLDPQSHQVMRSGQNINLSAKEFALLEYFMRNPNKTLSKSMIIENVWDFDADILPNNVEVFIGYLRSKLEKPFKNSPKLIHTLRGFGYTFGVKS